MCSTHRATVPFIPVSRAPRGDNIYYVWSVFRCRSARKDVFSIRTKTNHKLIVLKFLICTLIRNTILSKITATDPLESRRRTSRTESVWYVCKLRYGVLVLYFNLSVTLSTVRAKRTCKMGTRGLSEFLKIRTRFERKTYNILCCWKIDWIIIILDFTAYGPLFSITFARSIGTTGCEIPKKNKMDLN